MKKIIIIFSVVLIYSCNKSEKTDNKVNDEFIINYQKLEQFKGLFGRCSFKAPEGIFKKTEENIFLSKKLDARIDFISHRFDVGDDQFIGSKEEFIDKYKKDIKVDYITSNNNSFEIIGRTNKKNVFIMGYYYIGYSHDGETGLADFNLPFFSLVGVLNIQYPNNRNKEFKKIIPIIKKTYNCNFSEY